MAAPFDWGAEGARLGATLDHHHAIVVLGADADATAQVALGIGRAQAGRRRVAVGDLLGEAPPIQALLRGEDLHGIVDSFVYGVSLNRIAYEVPGTPGLFVMPTGTEPVDATEIFPSQRWKRLASGFREMGALLVLAAPADAPEVPALVAQMDGAILVGETVPGDLPVSAVISSVRRPVMTPVTDVPVDFEAVAPVPVRRVGIASVLKGAAALLVIAALGLWFAGRPFDRSGRRPAPGGRSPADSVFPIAGAGETAGVAGTRTGDSTRVVPAVRNPRDSATAAVYAVELLAANTAAGAAARVREEGEDLPAGTYAAAIVDGAEWYKVVAGAYTTREAADTLLMRLRREGKLDARSGSVVRLPYAFLVHSEVQDESLEGLLNAYRDLGQPVYALRQADGTLKIYAGAFESPDQAALLMASLRASGITPALVYRTGRVF